MGSSKLKVLQQGGSSTVCKESCGTHLASRIDGI